MRLITTLLCFLLLAPSNISFALATRFEGEQAGANHLLGVSMHPQRLTLPQWQVYSPGPNNAITDVSGIRVGHVTIIEDGTAPIRTGVTAVVPDVALLTQGKGNLANTGLYGAAVTLNGNGEMTGMGPLETYGVLNTPILLTNTLAVGAVHTGVDAYFQTHYGDDWPGALPVVTECWDGFYSTIHHPAVTPADAGRAIEVAQSGPVLQGRVGAGTGMRSFEMHAGIGSASRQVLLDGKIYTIGVLVNSNHSRLNMLNPQIRAALEKQFGPLEAVKTKDNNDRAVSKTAELPRLGTRQGSIIVVIGTDLPLTPNQLQLLAARAAIGIGNTGSVMATSSGDFAIAFSTANLFSVGNAEPALLPSRTLVTSDALTPVLTATIEAVTEAQINAIVASHSQ